MHIDIEVGVALWRPPAEHATIYISLSVELPPHDLTVGGLNSAMWKAETEARETACQIVMHHPNVVMPVRAEITGISAV